MPLTLPTVTYDASKTIITRKSFVSFTPVVAGVAGTQIDLIGKMADYSSKIATVQREIPDASGYLRPDRIVPIRQDEEFMFEIEDVTLLTSIFGGLHGGFVSGFARVFVVDPDDAASTAAVASNMFNCTCELDGGIPFKAGDLSMAKLKFTALSDVILTIDASN